MAGSERVWGYFSLRELVLMRDEQGLSIKVDPYWIPEEIE